MMNDTGEGIRSVAAALEKEGFPALSADEEALLVDYLTGVASGQEREAAEALAASYPDLAVILSRIQGEAKDDCANSEAFLKRLTQIATHQRREKALEQAWEKLRELARRLGDSIELNPFQLADFELAGSMLGGGEGEDLFPEELVCPMAGQSWRRSSFTVTIPDGATGAEFEVLDSQGQPVHAATSLPPGHRHEFSFSDLGLTEGSPYEWCLTFSDSGGAYQVRSGVVTPSDPEKRSKLDQLIRVAAVESDAFKQELLKCVLFFSHDVYDALLEKLRALYERADAGEQRRQVLMMLQCSYRRLRQHLSQNGFQEDSDRILERMAAVERQLEESALQPAA